MNDTCQMKCKQCAVWGHAHFAINPDGPDVDGAKGVWRFDVVDGSDISAPNSGQCPFCGRDNAPTKDCHRRNYSATHQIEDWHAANPKTSDLLGRIVKGEPAVHHVSKATQNGFGEPVPSVSDWSKVTCEKCLRSRPGAFHGIEVQDTIHPDAVEDPGVTRHRIQTLAEERAAADNEIFRQRTPEMAAMRKATEATRIKPRIQTLADHNPKAKAILDDAAAVNAHINERLSASVGLYVEAVHAGLLKGAHKPSCHGCRHLLEGTRPGDIACGHASGDADVRSIPMQPFGTAPVWCPLRPSGPGGFTNLPEAKQAYRDELQPLPEHVRAAVNAAVRHYASDDLCCAAASSGNAWSANWQLVTCEACLRNQPDASGQGASVTVGGPMLPPGFTPIGGTMFEDLIKRVDGQATTGEALERGLDRLKRRIDVHDEDICYTQRAYAEEELLKRVVALERWRATVANATQEDAFNSLCDEIDGRLAALEATSDPGMSGMMKDVHARLSALERGDYGGRDDATRAMLERRVESARGFSLHDLKKRVDTIEKHVQPNANNESRLDSFTGDIGMMQAEINGLDEVVKGLVDAPSDVVEIARLHGVIDELRNQVAIERQEVMVHGENHMSATVERDEYEQKARDADEAWRKARAERDDLQASRTELVSALEVLTMTCDSFRSRYDGEVVKVAKLERAVFKQKQHSPNPDPLSISFVTRDKLIEKVRVVAKLHRICSSDVRYKLDPVELGALTCLQLSLEKAAQAERAELTAMARRDD